MGRLTAIVLLGVVGVQLGGCALTTVLRPADDEVLEQLNRQRQQELLRALHEQAVQAHQDAVRAHHALSVPPIIPPQPQP
jgi:outer membrane biogenesis lipoprotein LolB